jgi:hypothetical protein
MISLEHWLKARDMLHWINDCVKSNDPCIDESPNATPPNFVTAAPQLCFDIDALLQLFNSDQPPKHLVCPTTTALHYMVLQMPLGLVLAVPH